MTYKRRLPQEEAVQNVGFMDRQMRALVGSVMIVSVMLAPTEAMGVFSMLWLLASIPVIASAIIGWDPFYALIGVSSYVAKEEDIHQRNRSVSNLGIVDRGSRIGLGVLLLVDLLSSGSMGTQMWLALLAIPLIATAIMAWDPIYALFGVNSFAARVDAEVAEPGVNDTTLAEYYEFPEIPSQKSSNPYAKAA